jgi:hypothetical protein
VLVLALAIGGLKCTFHNSAYSGGKYILFFSMSEWISLEIWINSFGLPVEAKALAEHWCRNTAEKVGRLLRPHAKTEARKKRA